MKRIISLLSISAILFTSCKKDKDEVSEYNPNVKADLSVEFDNVAGSADLQLNTGNYTNALGQQFKVTKLKYYVSNFKLTNVDGSVYTVPQKDCYFLIDESDATSHMPVLSVPEGEYKTLSFMIGVDSLRNTMDVSQRTGSLDVSGAAADMYWSWNSGYIFFKMDGTSPAITAMGGVFQYHVGGFGGYSTPTVNNLKTVTLTLPGAPVSFGSNNHKHIHTFVDALKVVNGTTNISVPTTPMVMGGPDAPKIAYNYKNMFVVDHIEAE